MTRRRSEDDYGFFDGGPAHMGAATPAPGVPKRAPRKANPIGFDLDPEAYRPKQRTRKRGGKS